MNPPPTRALRFPSIDGLRAFEAAARLGGLERAADELNVTASAISKRISTLEDLLGLPLLLRQIKPLGLTAAGKEYLEQVRAALALLTAVPFHQRSAQRQERLRITAPPTFARQILVPALPAFEASHPELELELLLSTPFLDDSAPAADVEIRNGEVEPEQVLLFDVVTPMAAPALLAQLARSGEPLVPADLARFQLLRTPLEPWTPWLRAAGLDWPEPGRGTRYVDLGLTLQAAACGQGVALGRPSLAAPMLRSGELRRLFALEVPAQKHYGAVQHSASQAAADFCNWLRSHCAGLALA
jgi:LysR family glycine cleavage system transcriptional activator